MRWTSTWRSLPLPPPGTSPPPSPYPPPSLESISITATPAPRPPLQPTRTSSLIMNLKQTVKNLMLVVQTGTIHPGFHGFATCGEMSYFVRLTDEYIQDDFNLCGLSSQVPYYDYALDLILDVESSHGDMFTEEQNELIESAAEMLYGLIHVRYILTSKGMAAMLEKYKNYDFGRCPRVYCSGQPCLPVGQSDIPRSSTVKLYCPKCEDIYYPRSKYQGNIDGAYFGTTFPHLFLMTYGHLKPQKPTQSFVPRVFGFKLHKP
ncbi:Casein kinase II subunit beta [Forsythia ovata]|uniref:Casein kinase II subunit beta n=1 Tax=Forsythia ovata TaxID=205694 RepID=A0ABD1TNL9_9LAMI